MPESASYHSYAVTVIHRGWGRTLTALSNTVKRRVAWNRSTLEKRCTLQKRKKSERVKTRNSLIKGAAREKLN